MISTAKYARIDNNISWVYSLFVTEGRWKMKAYCVGCHTKKEMKDPKIIILKNGRLAMMAICLTCGTTIWHIKPILKSQKEKVKGLTRTAPRKNMVKRTVSILRKKRSHRPNDGIIEFISSRSDDAEQRCYRNGEWRLGVCA